MKKTALAYSNIALIKYWGKSDDNLRIPLNDSFSFNLSGLKTITTVEFSDKFKKDDIVIDGGKNANEVARVVKHLDGLRSLSETKLFAKVISQNSFPSKAGLSSSASGFAALTLAACTALNLNLKEKELSIQARLGSGSASRSIPGGFVQWYKGENSDSSFASTVFPQNYWGIVDIVVVVSDVQKKVPTSDAQKYALTSPFMSKRLELVDGKIESLKKYIQQKNFQKFGEIVEGECLQMHAIIATQSPSFIYLLPETLSLMQKVRSWRDEGLQVFFTVNTGHDVHLICEEKDIEKVQKKIQEIKFIKRSII